MHWSKSEASARKAKGQGGKLIKSLSTSLKEQVRNFWNTTPCGTRGNPHPPGSRPYFDWIAAERDKREPFIARFARWNDRRGRRVLEMGTGVGSDFVRFARAGAHAVGVDISDHSLRLLQARLKVEGLKGGLLNGDIERLPFADGSFDLVYSWGVIHHTAKPQAAVGELLRVLRRGGEFCVMLYHRHSLVCLQAYLIHGLLKGKLFADLDSIAARHLESPGTKVYSRAQAARLFGDRPLRITHVVTPYDLRYSRFRSLPPFFAKLIPGFFGYFMVIEGKKPC